MAAQLHNDTTFEGVDTTRVIMPTTLTEIAESAFEMHYLQVKGLAQPHHNQTRTPPLTKTEME